MILLTLSWHISCVTCIDVDETNKYFIPFFPFFFHGNNIISIVNLNLPMWFSKFSAKTLEVYLN